MYKPVHAFHKFLCVYNMSSASVQPKEVISCCFQDFKNKILPWSLSQNIIRYSNREKKSQQRSHISYRLKLLPGRTVLHEMALTCLLLTSLIQKIFHPSISLRKMNSCGDHLFKMNQNISKIIFDINYALSVLIWYVATFWIIDDVLRGLHPQPQLLHSCKPFTLLWCFWKLYCGVLVSPCDTPGVRPP